jgi:hypothetical protein
MELSMNPVVEALALLTPYEIDIQKRRFGPPHDGGYVFADNISPSQAVVSYGISTEYTFDRRMAEAGHKVYMFDHTIEGIVNPHENMMWFCEGVAGRSDPAAKLYSIEDHLERHQIQGSRLILKMDVEGAELDAVPMTRPEVLCRFEQIAIEVHGLNALDNPAYRDRIVAMLRTLNRHFTLFHVHGNNFDGPNSLSVVSGMPVVSLMELSYIKTSIAARSPNRTLYPTALDFPNVRQKDKLLWFYPFLPTPVSFEEFLLCESRIELLEELDRTRR